MSRRPSARSSSSSSIVPWSIVSGVRSSCDAVATNERRAASWRRSSSCMRPNARARSPTSSRPASCWSGASRTPSRLIRTAALRSRPSRRSSVLESATASATATSSPTAPAASSALRTWSTAVVTSVSRRSTTSTPETPLAPNSRTPSRTSSPWTWVVVVSGAQGAQGHERRGAPGGAGAGVVDRLAGRLEGVDDQHAAVGALAQLLGHALNGERVLAAVAQGAARSPRATP